RNSGGAGPSGTRQSEPAESAATEEEPPRVEGGNKDEYDADTINKGILMDVIFYSDMEGVIQGVLRQGEELEEGEIPQKFKKEDIARIFELNLEDVVVEEDAQSSPEFPEFDDVEVEDVTEEEYPEMYGDSETSLPTFSDLSKYYKSCRKRNFN
ncbi:MAG: hypothetical protein Q8755_03300, partial [Candidatus Phytoplasma australasiaticum]|nr:hypothetical protein [Candidatus Phytoplasma australasiaticum]